MRLIVWFSVLVAIAAYICGPLMDPDLWWHITVGRWILANASIPVVDHWNLFAAGEPWRAYSWSNEVVFAFVDSHFGLHGLFALKVLLAVLLSFSLFYCLSRLAEDWFFGSVLGLFATVACYNHFTLRPQTLVWIYFIWLIYLSDQIVERGFRKGLAFGLCAVMCLWANAHITTALGLGVCAVWLFQRNNWKAASIGAAICFFGTLLTPYMGGEWLTFFSKSGHPFAHRAIVEFQPAHIMQHSTGFWVILAAFLALFLHLKPKLMPLPVLLLAGCFSLAALAIVKFLPLAVILLAAVVAVFWRKLGDRRAQLGNIVEAIEKARHAIDRIPKEGLAFVFICIAIVNVYPRWQEPLSKAIVPAQALDFLIDQKLDHPLLNDFGRGGYVMYRLSDAAGNLEHKVPIDGRTNVTTHEVWEKASASYMGKYNWHDYIDLVNPKSILWPTESPFTSILLETEDWCRVYLGGSQEKGYGIFIKRSDFERRAGLESDNCELS